MTKPRLRALDFQPVFHHGERMWLLRDPWQLSDRQLIFPQTLAQMLLLCDGTRSPAEIHAELCDELGADLPLTAVTEALAELDRTFLLQNERSESERRRHLHDYRSQHYRPPALSNLSYPAAPHELTALLEGYGDGASAVADPSRLWRGIVSPHIDYQRGGSVYAKVWRQAKRSVLEADLVLIFGTDHNGSPGSITLTPQPYATPYGILPNDLDLINRLAETIGEAAYAEELNHRNEHSIELSAVWLHHIFHLADRTPCPMVPILVGSFHHFLNNGAHPASDSKFNRFLDTLRRETSGRRVLAVGSVDLAHIGPAFGDSFAVDTARRSRLRQSDEKLMAAIVQGNAADFYHQIWAVRDQNRICGFAPLYLMLRFLETNTGSQIAYDHCPADQLDTSFVSICGLLLD